VETAASVFGWLSLIFFVLAFLNPFFKKSSEDDEEPKGFGKFITKGFLTFAWIAIITIVLHCIFVLNYTVMSWAGIIAGIIAIVALILGMVYEKSEKEDKSGLLNAYQVFNWIGIILVIVHLFVKS
jgi:hypothetical protein